MIPQRRIDGLDQVGERFALHKRTPNRSRPGSARGFQWAAT
jgi:hypothetical protein